ELDSGAHPRLTGRGCARSAPALTGLLREPRTRPGRWGGRGCAHSWLLTQPPCWARIGRPASGICRLRRTARALAARPRTAPQPILEFLLGPGSVEIRGSSCDRE